MLKQAPGLFLRWVSAADETSFGEIDKLEFVEVNNERSLFFK